MARQTEAVAADRAERGSLSQVFQDRVQQREGAPRIVTISLHKMGKEAQGGSGDPPVSPLSLLPAANRVRPHRVPALLLLRAGPVDAVEPSVAQGREAGHEQRRRLRRLVLGALLRLRQGVVLRPPHSVASWPVHSREGTARKG